MERDVKVNTELYQSLLNNALQLRLVKEGKVGNVRVLDEAVVPEEAGQAQARLSCCLALVLGLFGGVMLRIRAQRLRRRHPRSARNRGAHRPERLHHRSR